MHKENYHIYVRSIPSLKKLGGILGQNYKHRKKEKNSLKAWYDARYFYTQIKSVTPRKFEGKVYNLEVQSAHSYATQSACLHNCGDIMNLYIKVKDEVIVDAKFKTFGCGAAIATSSITTELVKGKTIEEALKISNQAVTEALGGLPAVKRHCSVLAEEALKSAIDDYRKKKA
ncbi:MAG: iron-sulfur cluster assembly scaffold protein [Elusimicrobia bacterium]|nr:iron-sulfur cluster assembly scaffold protein [Elusimicrobiota bacterium]